jgi:ATP-dependent DNA ligase
LYVDHVEQHVERLFHLACREDLEGVVAKLKDGRYNPERQSSWLKIKKPAYPRSWADRISFKRGTLWATWAWGRNPKLD